MQCMGMRAIQTEGKIEMTNEAKFKQTYPKATIESQKQNGPCGKRYYLVRESRFEHMYSGSGDTKAQAWANAAKNLPTS